MEKKSFLADKQRWGAYLGRFLAVDDQAPITEIVLQSGSGYVKATLYSDLFEQFLDTPYVSLAFQPNGTNRLTSYGITTVWNGSLHFNDDQSILRYSGYKFKRVEDE